MEYNNAARIELSDTQFLQTIFEAEAGRAVVQFPERRGFVGLAAADYWQALGVDHPETRYYCVSLFDADPGVRRIEAFERQCVLVIDDIGEKAPESAFSGLPTPTYKMFSSPASQQWGWVLTDTPAARDRGKLDHLIHHIIDRYFDGKDPGLAGVTRVVRTPGSYNMKESRRLPDGSAPRAKLYHFQPFTRYSLEVLAEKLGCNLDEAEDVSAAHGIPAEWPADAPLVQAIERGDIEVFREGREAGELIVECPNREQHTLDDDGHRSGKLYMKADGSGGYKCHHGSCKDFKFPQFLAAHGIKDAHDSWVNGMKFQDLIAQIPASPAPAQNQKDPAPATPTLAQTSTERPPWRVALDNLAGVPDPVADLQALDGLVDAILGLEPIEQGVALNDLQRALKGHMTSRDLDRVVKSKRRAYGKDVAASKRAALAGQTALSGYVALPGEIDWPITGPTGDPLLHTDNMAKLVDYWGITVRMNVMTHIMQINVPGVSIGGDDVENGQITVMKSIAKASGLPTDGILEYLNHVANARPFHPAVEAMSVEAWDGKDRFHRLLEVLPTPHPEILAKVLRRWMRQAVVAAFELYPTTPRKDVLTFLGEQSAGKSTFLQLLTMGIPRAFRGGHHLDVSNKDSLYSATSTWICELGEIDSTFKKDVAALKAFLANTEDTLREPYAARPATRPRRTVFAGTVNEREFLVDDTGNSRFRVVELNGKVNLDRMRELVDDGVIAKIWAQMRAEVEAGEPWYFSQTENAELEEHGEQYRRKLPIEAAIHAVFNMDQPIEEWIEWKPSDVHARLEAAGHKCHLNQMGQGIRAAVKRYTGQVAPHRTASARFWLLPPVVAGGNVVHFPPAGSR